MLLEKNELLEKKGERDGWPKGELRCFEWSEPSEWSEPRWPQGSQPSEY